MDLNSPGLIDRKPQKSCHILSHVDHGFPRRRVNDSDWSDLLLDNHRLSVSGRQSLRWTFQDLGFIKFSMVRCWHKCLSIVNITEYHITCPDLPGFIREDLILPSLRVLHHQLQNHLVLIAIVVDGMIQTESPLIPSVCQKYFQLMLSVPDLYLISLVLDPAVVISTARRQIFIPHPLAIQI